MGPPSMECLMTLLWATKVIHEQWLKSQKSLAKEGTIKDTRQQSLKLDELFKLRLVGRKGNLGNVLFGGTGKGARNGWRRGVENSE